MNNDLISREALRKLAIWTKVNNGAELIDIEVVPLDAIDNATPVKAFTEEDMAGAYNEGYACGSREDKRPQGEWITRHKLNSFGQDVVCFECNKCGEYKVPLYHLLITEPLKVCPNCGADMRKGGAE